MYIGISVTPNRRKHYHRASGKPFDTFDISEAYPCMKGRGCKGCGKGAIREIELIHKHRPILNDRDNPSSKNLPYRTEADWSHVIDAVQFLSKNFKNPSDVESRALEQLVKGGFDPNNEGWFYYVKTTVKNAYLQIIRSEQRYVPIGV